jgi:predicted acylesterase/phospholipase RssA
MGIYQFPGEVHLKEVLGPFARGFDGNINKCRALIAAVRGHDILNVTGLRHFIEGLFMHTLKRIPELIMDVELIRGTKLFIIATDLTLGRSHVFSNTDNLINSLINSCAYPFAFRNFKAIKSTPYVDGGLCENLPADLLDKKSIYGHVFALSPKERAKLSGKSFNILSYMNSLIGASINNSVLKTKTSVGDSSVIQFESALSTFSFKEALSISYDTKIVEDIKKKSKSKINYYLHIVSISPDDGSIIFYGGTFNSVDILKSVYILHKNLNKGATITPIETSMIAMANCLDTVEQGDPRKCDIITHRNIFMMKNTSIRALSVQVYSDGEMLAMRPLVWSVRHLRTRRRLAAELIPAIPDDAT